MKVYKVKELINIIEKDGWKQVLAKGGHRQYKHLTKKGRVTISGKLSADVPLKTAQSIFRQAGLEING